MGCVSSEPVTPDGDGITALMWQPHEVERGRAASNLKGQWQCQLLVNQQAIFSHLSGSQATILKLPYAPDANTRGRAGSNLEGHWVTRALANQQAIFNKLSGEQVVQLPYIADAQT